MHPPRHHYKKPPLQKARVSRRAGISYGATSPVLIGFLLLRGFRQRVRFRSYLRTDSGVLDGGFSVLIDEARMAKNEKAAWR
jgi:hypothetical protein